MPVWATSYSTYLPRLAQLTLGKTFEHCNTFCNFVKEENNFMCSSFVDTGSW